MMTTAKHALAEREDDQRGEGDDRDRLARDDVRHEGPLEQPEWTKIVASASPSSAPRTNPIAASRQRVERRAEQVLAEALVARRAGTAGRSATAMFQTCGSLRSFANGQRNGGFQRTGEPGPGADRLAPRDAAEELDALPDDQDDREDEHERHDRPATPAPVRGRALAADPTRGRGPRSRSSPPSRRPPGRRCRARVDDLEALGELVLGDAQRRVRVDRVVGDHRVQAVARGRTCRSPSSRRDVPLNGVSGVHGSRDCGRGRGCRTGPRLRWAPTDGCLAAQRLVVVAHDARRAGAAFSMQAVLLVDARSWPARRPARPGGCE